jgi:hypothetical protein
VNDAEFVVAGSFVDESNARAAAGALWASGVRDDDVEVVVALPTGAGEVRFVWRLVWIVVLWSVVGGAVGALLGAGVVWAGIGGGGTLAIVLQIIGWMIFGHLIAGMWAGYVLLADRSKREFTPDAGDGGGLSVVRVRCRDRAGIERARDAMMSAGATSVDVLAGGAEATRVRT